MSDNAVNGTEVNTFEIPASTLHDLLTATIPLASTEITMPSINCVQLRRVDDCLIATATDRYVLGIARKPLNPTIPWPEIGWSFPIGLKDAKTLLKLCKSHRRDPLARVRMIDDDMGMLHLPISDLHFRALGSDNDAHRKYLDGFPPIGNLLQEILSTVHDGKQVVGGLNPKRVGQFSNAMKVFPTAIPYWWNASLARGDIAPRWAVHIEDGPDSGMIGAVLGMHTPAGKEKATDITSWKAVLK